MVDWENGERTAVAILIIGGSDLQFQDMNTSSRCWGLRKLLGDTREDVCTDKDCVWVEQNEISRWVGLCYGRADASSGEWGSPTSPGHVPPYVIIPVSTNIVILTAVRHRQPRDWFEVQYRLADS
jgi:hypothetical protein